MDVRLHIFKKSILDGSDVLVSEKESQLIGLLDVRARRTILAPAGYRILAVH